MPKRRARVKLSKAQILENDRNKWSAKKEAAIDMLCKAMEHLTEVERRQRRLDRAQTVEASIKREGDRAKQKAKDAKHLPMTEESFQASVDAIVKEHVGVTTPAAVGDRAQRMKAMGFRSTKRRKSNAQEATTG